MWGHLAHTEASVAKEEKFNTTILQKSDGTSYTVVSMQCIGRPLCTLQTCPVYSVFVCSLVLALTVCLCLLDSCAHCMRVLTYSCAGSCFFVFLFLFLVRFGPSGALGSPCAPGLHQDLLTIPGETHT